MLQDVFIPHGGNAAFVTSQIADDVILEPVLKWKVDELFHKWLSLPSTLQYLQEVTVKVRNNEYAGDVEIVADPSANAAVTPTPPPLSSPRNHTRPKKPFSPRGSPTPAKVPTPRKEEQQTTPSEDVPDAREPSPRKPPSPDSAKQPSPRLPPQQNHSTPRELSANIPRFYFPKGQPLPDDDLAQTETQLREAFDKLPNRKASKVNIHPIMRILKLPLYLRVPLMQKCFKSDNRAALPHVPLDALLTTWRNIVKDCHSREARFIRVISKTSSDFLVPKDFDDLLQDVVDTHPGLLFLQEAKEFHSRYVTTVVSRIFYSVNRSWSGRISRTELGKSNLIDTFFLLQEEDDINRITDFFSYEHFYVIYCKFWDLDLDRDLLLSFNDLVKHDSHAVSVRAIERIFEGTVSKKLTNKNMKMTYSDFVWFLLSEEDKQNPPTSVEYWFRVMDLDGDGVLSMYELEHFWGEQLQRMMQQHFADLLPFNDILCEMLDLVKPTHPDRITLNDLRRCKLTHIFFNTFLNFKKFLDIQQRQNSGFYRGEEDDASLSDWERYANEEYERLVCEEANDSYISYEDDFEVDSPRVAEPVNAEAAEIEVEKLDLNALSLD